jgi:DNA-binding transcriptional LysR family regulator
MEIRNVEMFLRVLEQGSVTGAARSLGVTQPAVSSAIARLVVELGFDLFRRDGRTLVPTAEALQFEQEARRALLGLAQLEEAASGISAARRGTLTIAASPGAAIAWLPGAVARFRATRPDVIVRLLTRSSLEVRGLVASNAADIGVAQPPFDRGDNVLQRFRCAPVCVLPRTHALAAQTCITPSLLDGENFIALSRYMTPRMAIAEAFEDVGATCHVVVECESFATAMNLVAAGVGVAISEPVVARAMAGPDVVLRPLLPALTYELALLAPLRTGLTRLATAFADAFTAYVALLLDESILP